MESKTSEGQIVNCSENNNLSRLENIVKKLENITDKLAGTSFPDSYDDFGRVIALLLRELPEKNINTIKTKILNIILRERRTKMSVKRNSSTPSQQSTKDSQSTVQNKPARGLKRKVLSGTSSRTQSPESSNCSLLVEGNDELTKNNDLTQSKENTSNLVNNHSCTSSIPLPLSHLSLPTDCNVNNGFDIADCEDINDFNLQELKKGKLEKKDSVPSTTPRSICELRKDTVLSSNNNSLPKCNIVENDVQHEHFLPFKFPLRTYKTIKKKKTDFSVFNTFTHTENKIGTLKSPTEECRLESITLPSTPIDKNIITLPSTPIDKNIITLQSVKEAIIMRTPSDHVEPDSVPSSNAQTASVDNCVKRVPKNCLLNIESTNNVPAQNSLSDNDSLQPTEEMEIKCEVVDNSEPNQSENLFRGEVEFKCEELDISDHSQADSMFTEEVTIKREEDIDEPNMHSRPPIEEVTIKEESTFEAVFCENTDQEIVRNCKVFTEKAKNSTGAVGSDGKTNGKTSLHYTIPTLPDRYHASQIRKKVQREQPPVFLTMQEYEISQHMMTLAKTFYGISKFEIRRLIFEYSEANNIKLSCSVQSRIAGSRWLNGFLKRNPIDTGKKTDYVGQITSVSCRSPEVQLFYSNIKCAMDKHSFDPSRIYNYDESAISTIYKSDSKLFASSSSVKNKNITVCCAVSAGGTYVPPMLIYPGSGIMHLSQKMLMNAIYHCSKNGKINEELFVVWLNHFDAITKPTKENPVLLIMDNHKAHTTLAAYKICEKNNIIIVSTPTSNYLHPLGVTFYRSLKVAFSHEYDSYMEANRLRKIQFKHIAFLFKEAYNKVADIEKGVSGFLHTGIFPLDTSRITDNYFFITSLKKKMEDVNTLKICEDSICQYNNKEVTKTYGMQKQRMEL